MPENLYSGRAVFTLIKYQVVSTITMNDDEVSAQQYEYRGHADMYWYEARRTKTFQPAQLWRHVYS